MKIEIETDIAAPPAVVFATAIDIANWPIFLPAIEQVDMLTAGPIGVGTRFRETRTMFGRKAAEEMTVALIDPPHRFDLTAENHGTRYLGRHEVVPAPGGARLRLTFSGTAVTFGARLGMVLGFLFKGALRRQLRADFEALKAEAERRARD
jgi:hypothetical protein